MRVDQFVGAGLSTNKNPLHNQKIKTRPPHKLLIADNEFNGLIDKFHGQINDRQTRNSMNSMDRSMNSARAGFYLVIFNFCFVDG